MDQVRAFVRSEMITKSASPMEERFTVYFQYRDQPAELHIFNEKGKVHDFQYLGRYCSSNPSIFEELIDPEFQCLICNEQGSVVYKLQQWDTQLIIKDIVCNRIIWVTSVEPSYAQFRIYVRI